MTTFLSTDLRHDAYTWLALEMPWGGMRAFYVPAKAPPEDARKRDSGDGSGYQKAVRNDG